MVLFKTVDVRGLHFTYAFELALKELRRIKKNGILEIILDKKKNFTAAFKNWARDNGHNFSDLDNDNRMIRIFIEKGRKKRKVSS